MENCGSFRGFGFIYIDEGGEVGASRFTEHVMCNLQEQLQNLRPQFWGRLWILNKLIKECHMHSFPSFYFAGITYHFKKRKPRSKRMYQNIVPMFRIIFSFFFFFLISKKYI